MGRDVISRVGELATFSRIQNPVFEIYLGTLLPFFDVFHFIFQLLTMNFTYNFA